MPAHQDHLSAIRMSHAIRYAPVQGSRDLVIVFSERSQGYAHKTSFSCGQQLVAPDINRLLLRDMKGLWYHAGIEGISTSLPGTIAFLRDFVERGDFRKVGIMGMSSGTHAAFVTGCHIPVDAVICAACRFDLRQDTRAQLPAQGSDLRECLDRLWSDPNIDRRFLNARDAAEMPGAAGSPVRLYYDPANRRDAHNAAHLRGLATVTEIPCPGLGHNVHGLARIVFERDPLLGGRARYADPTAALDRNKLAAGERLRAALLAATRGTGEA